MILRMLAASAMLFSVCSVASATTFGLTNYATTTGSQSSVWDIFSGDNYQASYSYISTGTPLTLNITNTGKVSGPVDGDAGTVPGDREQFYTHMGTSAFGISGNATGSFQTIYLQVKFDPNTLGGLNNVLLNGVPATTTNVGTELTEFKEPGTGYTRNVTTWIWNVNLSEGQAFSFTWDMGIHSTFDAIQLDFVAVPEPMTMALLGGGLILIGWKIRRKGRQEPIL